MEKRSTQKRTKGGGDTQAESDEPSRQTEGGPSSTPVPSAVSATRHPSPVTDISIDATAVGSARLARP